MIKKSPYRDEQFLFGRSRKEILTYAAQFLAVFAGTFILLAVFGLIPEEFMPARSAQRPQPVQTSSDEGGAVGREAAFQHGRSEASGTTVPTRIIIGKIDVDSVIEHPQSQNVEVLDEALKRGAVYYPGSGTIEDGNIFLFGHSTNWPVVQNEAYKTFNGLEKLRAGDTITIWGSDGEIYTYIVQDVSLVNDDEALVHFNTTETRLTISTCNTFGAKQERWVVEAVRQG